MAAFLHAGWNVLAKRAGGEGLQFIWLFTAVSTALWAPAAVAVVVMARPRIGLVQLLFMAGTGLMHLTYFALLQRGYAAGDLSLVYPLARGTGPMLSLVGAILLLGERPGKVALAGGLLVCVGVLLLARGSPAGPAVMYALATGALIAVYTLWDAHAVRALAVPPLLLGWSSDAGRTVVLYPFVRRRWSGIRSLWGTHRAGIVGIALMSTLAYVLVLTALRFSAVSYVAPAREMSILIGTFLGARLLAERQAKRRTAASLAIVTGVIALAVG